MLTSMCVFVGLLLSVNSVQAFTSPNRWVGSVSAPTSYSPSRNLVVMEVQKKKRKRKKAPDAGSDVESQSASLEGMSQDEKEELSEEDLAIMKDVASFEFKADDAIAMGIEDEEVIGEDGNQFKLPDIKDALRKKEIEEEIARIAEEEKESKPRIKRGDAKAFKKLYDSNPFADADDELFEEAEYNVVSALLGERAEPFLNIPTGPIQVGHFIGALGIVLMAFVEYPGFPLTNLPTAVRESFQGGLATVYAINTVLAVLSVFKASERGQPALLWVAKSFAVGGLAFDQLTQLPTLEEVKIAESVKGKRAQKRNKR